MCLLITRKQTFRSCAELVSFGPLADVEHAATLLVEVVHLALALAPTAWRNGSRRARRGEARLLQCAHAGRVGSGGIGEERYYDRLGAG